MEENCTSLNKLYKGQFAKLSSINTTVSGDFDETHSLYDYYIKTAYNCCCSGNFKNDFVNECALTSTLKQGARCLDFEIYSIDNKPVIAASSIE